MQSFNMTNDRTLAFKWVQDRQLIPRIGRMQIFRCKSATKSATKDQKKIL